MGPTILAPPGHKRAGFDDCYHATYGRITAQLTAYLADATEAEDVAQDAFLRAWQRWDKISSYDDPVAWIRRVAWNLATSRWRRVVREANFVRRQITPEATGLLGPDNVALVTALRQVRPQIRQVIVMHYIADMPVAEIAADLGRPRGTIVSWLHRGRKELANLLRDNNFGEGVKP